MKAIKIDAEKKIVEEIDIEGSLAGISRALGDQIEEWATIARNDTLYVTKTAINRKLADGFTFGEDLIIGTGVITGETEKGEYCEPANKIELIKELVTFKTKEEIYQHYRNSQ